MPWLQIAVASIIGAVVGFVVFPVAVGLFFFVFARYAFRDGQTCVVFIFAALVGATAGASGAGMWAARFLNQPVLAGIIGLVGGIVLVYIGLVAAWAQERPANLASLLWSLLGIQFGCPLLWGSILCGTAIAILARR